MLGLLSLPAHHAFATPVSVAVDLSALSKQVFQQYQVVRLYRKLLVRLTQARFAVVDASLASQVRVAILAAPKGLRVSMRAGGPPLEVTVVQGKDTIEQYHIEVLHKTLSLARRLRAQVAAREAARRAVPPLPALPRPVAPRPLPRPATPPGRWRAEIDLGVSALYRIQGVDLQPRLGFRWGKEKSGFGVYSSLFLAPSISDKITIIEWGLQLGPSWRQPLTSFLSLEFGLLLGFTQHSYYFGLGEDGQDSRWDFVGSFLFLANWQVTRNVGFRTWLGFGLTTQSRVHRLDGDPLWERSLLRFEGGVSAFLSF